MELTQTPALPSSHLSSAAADFAYGVEKGHGLSPRALETPEFPFSPGLPLAKKITPHWLLGGPYLLRE